MIITTRTSLERELLKDLILVLAAALLTALACGVARGQEPSIGEPKLLPPEVIQQAQPMPTPLAADVLPPNAEQQPTPYVDPIPFLRGVDSPERVWNVLNLQRDGYVDEAIAGWQRLVLPADAEVWRQVALAQAYLSIGQLDAAETALDAAAELDANNPLVYYFTGLVHINRAKTARDWYDAAGPATIRLVSTAAPKVAPNSRGMYQLAAMAALNRAIELANKLPLTERLVSDDFAYSPVVAPNVGDLLVALHADNFEAKSYCLLAGLSLQRHLPEESERHLDAARAMGLPVGNGYEEVAAYYHAEGRHAAAFRANLKSMTQGHGVVRPLQAALHELQEAIWDQD